METLFLIITIGFSTAYFTLMLLHLTGWFRGVPPAQKNKNLNTKVSVVISARNEEENIKPLLDCLFKQSYGQELMQILIVDDNSEDHTFDCISQFKTEKNWSQLEAYQLKPPHAGKKRALDFAIRQTTGELIITTDADCTMEPGWVEEIVSFYEANNPEMIFGPVSFKVEKNFFEQMQSLEFLGLIGMTNSFANNRMPIMCNGANLAYRREAFINVGGFEGVEDSQSGDDMQLLIKFRKFYSNKSLMFLRAPDSIVYTSPECTFKGFMNQRKRWASNSWQLKGFDIILVGLLILLLNLWIMTLGITSIFIPDIGYLCLSLFLYKSLIDFIILFPVARFYNKTRLLINIVPSQLMYFLYITIVAVSLPLTGYKWKGRNVK